MGSNKEMRRNLWNSKRIFQIFSFINYIIYIPLIQIVFILVTRFEGISSIKIIEFLPGLIFSLLFGSLIWILTYFRKFKPTFLGEEPKDLNWIVYKRGNYFLLILTYLYFIFYLPVFYFVKLFPFRSYKLPTSLGQYQEMDDSDKLKSPSYEKQESGVKISTDSED